MVKSKFTWNNTGRNIFMEQATVKAINATAHDLMQAITSARVVPFDEGNLESTVHVGKATLNFKMARVIWDFKDKQSGYIYAARLYFHPELNFQNGRKGRWAEAWTDGHKQKDVVKMYEKNLKAVISK